MALRLNASAIYPLANIPLCHRPQSCILGMKPIRICKNYPTFCCSMSRATDQPEEPSKLSIGFVMDKARNVWESSPDVVKSFPWNNAFDKFIQLIIDLALTVFKYLSIPLFAVTSLSEMSYCAHERKLFLVPFPFLLGLAIAGILQDAALESTAYLKDAEVPWHLIAVATPFAMLKLVGPSYPYWGRILIPHIVNGALCRIIWSTFSWLKRSHRLASSNTN